jgi:hypothetical protein
MTAAAPLHTRKLLVFLFLCVNARLVVVLLAWLATRVAHPLALPLAGVLLGLGPGLAFALRFLRSSSNAPGAVFGDPAWWHPLRAVHAATYGLFGVLAIMRVRWAWAVLLVDVTIGIVAFAAHYGLVAPQG